MWFSNSTSGYIQQFHSMDMNLSKFREIVEVKEGWCAWGCKESDLT